MSTHMTREEFDRRMRWSKAKSRARSWVTRFILEQTQRQRRRPRRPEARRIDHLSSDVALVRGAVTATALLNVLVQDVGQLRQEMGGVRGIWRVASGLQQDMTSCVRTCNETWASAPGMVRCATTSLQFAPHSRRAICPARLRNDHISMKIGPTVQVENARSSDGSTPDQLMVVKEPCAAAHSPHVATASISPTRSN